MAQYPKRRINYVTVFSYEPRLKPTFPKLTFFISLKNESLSISGASDILISVFHQLLVAGKGSNPFPLWWRMGPMGPITRVTGRCYTIVFTNGMASGGGNCCVQYIIKFFLTSTPKHRRSSEDTPLYLKSL